MAVSTPRTSVSAPALPTTSSRFTTSQSTVLTTWVSTPSLASPTIGFTPFPLSTTSLTSASPAPSTARTTGLLTSSAPGPPSSASSPASTWPSGSTAGACSVKEYVEEITFQGCSANATLTRCEGFCPSSSRINPGTLKLETGCGCCHPLATYTKDLPLQCPDRGTPGRRLVVQVQVFSSCVCNPRRCAP
ncbi:mucin-6-like [Sarcophilus harrisii]